MSFAWDASEAIVRKRWGDKMRRKASVANIHGPLTRVRRAVGLPGFLMVRRVKKRVGKRVCPQSQRLRCANKKKRLLGSAAYAV